MRRFAREQSLSLVFLALFLASLVGQAIAGWHDYNNLETWHALMAGETPETLSLGRYITSSSFAQAVTENWQSEYLQFTLFILLTVWFIQKGSPESKQPGEEGGESDEEQSIGRHARPDSPKWAKAGGWRLAIYSNSLVLVVRPVGLGLEREQRRAARARAAVAVVGRVPGQRRLLADDAAELAVRVPRRGVDGGAGDLPAPARLAGVQAGWLPARRDVGGGVGCAVDADRSAARHVQR